MKTLSLLCLFMLVIACGDSTAPAPKVHCLHDLDWPYGWMYRQSWCTDENATPTVNCPRPVDLVC